ncbi:hypothetical protein CEP52_014021 [Fusarium oligoseptatum]|uniref:Uncharacterized protein n=2 Tax=Fusarium solani species complex TaxID=232080 RepID=A0A428SQQ6_9HYPO|nr:hypothetical protein CEP51_010604 [Fusarium floridanum]RSL92112.1 hypothetical protein CEP52_014021 [Fusarium oligoseptatum]
MCVVFLVSPWPVQCNHRDLSHGRAVPSSNELLLTLLPRVYPWNTTLDTSLIEPCLDDVSVGAKVCGV